MPYSVETIGKAFSAERERRDLTQRALAQLAGTTQARISKIENGETDPRFSTLIEMARALDLELVLVPRRHLPAVNGISALDRPRDVVDRTSDDLSTPRPAYRLDEDDDG